MNRTRHLPAHILGVGLALLAGGACAGALVSTPQPSLSAEPTRADLNALNKGQLALRLRQFEQAEKAFSEAYKLNPRSVEAMVGLAAATQGQGQGKLARDWMSSAVAMAPGQAGVLQAQARLLVEQGLPGEAEASYHAAIASQPGTVQLKLDLASLYLEKLKKPALAVAQLREVLKQHPELAQAHLGLALALSAEGKTEEAGRAIDEAVRRDPGNSFALHAQGMIALKQSQADRALAAFDKALAVRKDFAGAMLGRGDALLALGKGDQAVEAYARAASLVPTSALPHALRGQAFERMKRPADAEAAYRAGIRVEPEDVRLANNLAFVLASQRIKLDEALTLARKAVTKDEQRASYHDTLGVVLMARNELPAARQAFERGLALDPANAALRQHHAQLGTPQAAAPVQVAAAAAVPVALKAAPPAVAAAPAPAPVTAPAPVPVAATPAADPTPLVASRLEAWRQAWEAKDASRYLAFYGSNFVPTDKRARSAWEADRRVKLDKKGEIQVSLGTPSYKVEGDVVSVSFEQRYRSGNYSDAGRKQIEWVREGGDWKIRREAQL